MFSTAGMLQECTSQRIHPQMSPNNNTGWLHLHADASCRPQDAGRQAGRPPCTACKGPTCLHQAQHVVGPGAGGGARAAAAPALLVGGEAVAQDDERGQPGHAPVGGYQVVAQPALPYGHERWFTGLPVPRNAASQAGMPSRCEGAVPPPLSCADKAAAVASQPVSSHATAASSRGTSSR
jgi:hypothetical protein